MRCWLHTLIFWLNELLAECSGAVVTNPSPHKHTVTAPQPHPSTAPAGSEQPPTGTSIGKCSVQFWAVRWRKWVQKMIYYIRFYTFLWSLSILMATSVADTLEELLTHSSWAGSSTVCIPFVSASNSVWNLQLNLQLTLPAPQNNCNRTDFPRKTSLNKPHETQYAASQCTQSQQAVNPKGFSLKQVIPN